MIDGPNSNVCNKCAGRKIHQILAGNNGGVGRVPEELSRVGKQALAGGRRGGEGGEKQIPRGPKGPLVMTKMKNYSGTAEAGPFQNKRG